MRRDKLARDVCDVLVGFGTGPGTRQGGPLGTSPPDYMPQGKLFYYPVDISTTVFSYSRAVQYHAILHGTGVIARVLLHGPWGYAVS